MVVNRFDFDPALGDGSYQPVGPVLVWLAAFVGIADCLLDLKARQAPLREPLTGVISPDEAFNRQ